MCLWPTTILVPTWPGEAGGLDTPTPNACLNTGSKGLVSHVSSSPLHTPCPYPHLRSVTSPTRVRTNYRKDGAPAPPPGPLCAAQAPHSLDAPDVSCHPGRCPVHLSSPAVESEPVGCHLLAPLSLPPPRDLSPSDNPRRGLQSYVTSLGGRLASRSPNPQLQR